MPGWAVCGALGAYDQARLERMREALGGGMDEVHRADGAVAWARGPATSWRGDREAGVAWPDSAQPPASRPSSWRDAARLLGAGGVAAGPGRAWLHTSVAGAAPLYVLSTPAATYFSSRVHALALGSPERLSPDWQAWSAILALGYPPGDRTPFAEIRRVRPLTRVEHAPGRGAVLHTDPWPWAEETGDAPSADAAPTIAAALRDAMRGFARGERATCPLSGGWDSRLLACLLVERGADVTCFTINTDNGRDRDERLAAAAAAELGLPLEIVDAGARPFGTELADAGALLDYQCAMHLPMVRLGRRLWRTPEPIVDGLGGDIWVKALFVDREVATAPWDDALGLLWGQFTTTSPDPPCFRAGVWRELEGTARAAFTAEAERFRGHRSGPSLAMFWTRTRRAVALAPFCLFGAERAVSTPFIADEAALAALAAPLEDKLDGALYRRVFAEVNPRVGALPSTNDPEGGDFARDLPRREHAREARRWYLERLAESPLRPLLSAPLEELVAAATPGRMRPFLRPQAKRTLRAIALFGLWRDAYAESLRPFEVRDAWPPAGQG